VSFTHSSNGRQVSENRNGNTELCPEGNTSDQMTGYFFCQQIGIRGGGRRYFSEDVSLPL
jgi:hypothetical protein